MKPQDPTPFDADKADAAFEEYLRRGSSVSSQYRELDDAQIPPALDRAVLSQAHAAASTTKRSRLLRWSAPLAAAASVVVVLSLVMQPSVRREVAGSAAPASPSPQAFPRESKAEKSGTLDNEMSAPAMQAPSQFAESKEFAVEAKRAAAAVRERTGSSSESAAARADNRLSNSVSQAPPPPPSIEMSRSRPLYESTQSTRSAPAADAALPSSSSKEEQEAIVVEGRATTERLQDVPMSITAAPPVASPAPQAPGAGPRNTIPASAGAGSVNDAATDKAALNADPLHWLEQIRQLRRAGKVQQADREWRRFTAAYPGYTVDSADSARPEK